MLKLTNLKNNVELNDKQAGEIIGGAAGALGGSIVGSLTALYDGRSAKDIFVYSGIGALGGGIAGAVGGPVGAKLS